jgi:hypothetical protein
VRVTQTGTVLKTYQRNFLNRITVSPVKLPLKFAGNFSFVNRHCPQAWWYPLDELPGFNVSICGLAIPASGLRKLGIFVPDSTNFVKGQIYQP